LFLWRTSGSFAFDAIRQTLSALLVTRPLLAHTIIFLFFLGFATKAGILPMGDWLPDAHPVAPSGMSAILSGALVKLGIYGLVRLFFFFLVVSSSLKIWGILGTRRHRIAFCRDLDRTAADRHQAADGLPHHRANRLHLPRPRSGDLLSRHVPEPRHHCPRGHDSACCEPRLLQVLLVSWRRLGALPDR